MGELMKKLAFVLTLLPVLAYAGWWKTYGGDSTDVGRCVQQTSDGGYIITGNTCSFENPGSHKIWLLKTDSDGDTIWTRTFGKGFGYCVDESSDGGYVLTGYANMGFTNVLRVLKIDTQGEILWQKDFIERANDAGRFIDETHDKGYVLVGASSSVYTGSDLWFLKIDSLGNEERTRLYGQRETGEIGYCIKQTRSLCYIIVGTIEGTKSDIWLLKTDGFGDTLWTRIYGGEQKAGAYSVSETTDSGYIICGWKESTSEPPSTDVWLLKTDSLGDTLWTKTHGGLLADKGFWVEQVSDGGYVLVGETASFGNGLEVLLIRTDIKGDTLWTRTFGGMLLDGGYCVRQTADKGYIIVGHTNSVSWQNIDFYLIKTDSMGYIDAIEEESVADIIPSFEATPISQQIVLRYSDRPQGFHASIFDATGRKVDELRSSEQSGTITCGEGYKSGVYFVREESETTSTTRKVILIR